MRNEFGAYGGLMIDYLAVKKAVLKIYDPETYNTGNENDFAYTLDRINNRGLRKLIQNKSSHEPKCKRLWFEKLNIDISNYYMVPFQSTKEGRLRSLQFKIIHHIYPTNILLHKMGIKNSDSCSFCGEMDTYPHFFYRCHTLTTFWEYIESLICLITGNTISLNTNNVLFGLTGENISNKYCLREANLLILLGKLAISKNRYNKKQQNIKLMLQFEIMIRKRNFTILNDEIDLSKN